MYIQRMYNIYVTDVNKNSCFINLNGGGRTGRCMYVLGVHIRVDGLGVDELAGGRNIVFCDGFAS